MENAKKMTTIRNILNLRYSCLLLPITYAPRYSCKSDHPPKLSDSADINRGDSAPLFTVLKRVLPSGCWCLSRFEMRVVRLNDCVLVDKPVFHDKIQFIFLKYEIDILKRVAIP